MERWMKGGSKEYCGRRYIAWQPILAERLRRPSRIETATLEGFTLFQGYYLCYPQVLTNRAVPPNIQVYSEIFRELQRSKLYFRMVSKRVELDPALTFRFLRFVYSAALVICRDVRSVETALIAIGEYAFRRIVMLAVAAALSSGRSRETLRLALERARFCALGQT